mmetsp:Transcript_13852/g.19419  ORF Transcript_13852/g.19419 Transcript_13852/m.19419 type:complete len:192 (+) Transcript_13852:187-762(+)
MSKESRVQSRPSVRPAGELSHDVRPLGQHIDGAQQQRAPVKECDEEKGCSVSGLTDVKADNCRNDAHLVARPQEDTPGLEPAGPATPRGGDQGLPAPPPIVSQSFVIRSRVVGTAEDQDESKLSEEVPPQQQAGGVQRQVFLPATSLTRIVPSNPRGSQKWAFLSKILIRSGHICPKHLKNPDESIRDPGH